MWYEQAEGLARDAGLPGLRPAQSAVLRLLERGDVLALLPTGSGKSLCYWLPALAGTPTLVISPLRSLMADQLAGLPPVVRPLARMVHSAQLPSQRREAWAAWASGRARLLYLAPEGLAAGEDSLRVRKPGLVAVDEAHCAVTWGSDFRPAYQALAGLRGSSRVPWLALTASADRPTADAIVQWLGLRAPAVVRQDADRPEIAWLVSRAEPASARLARLRRLSASGAGLLYVDRRAMAAPLAAELAACGRVARYHAGMAASARAAVEEAWSARRLDMVVATVAFGLGIDRPDVRWVAHWTPPRRWDDLWQHAGRAGRDGQNATSLNWAMEFRHLDQVMRTYLTTSACRRAVLRSALARGWDRPWDHGAAVGVAPPPCRPALCCDRCDEVAELAA